MQVYIHVNGYRFFCQKRIIHLDHDRKNYVTEGKICPLNLSYCELDCNAWERKENFREPGLLDHFLTEHTEDYCKQDYLGIDSATWKV